MEHGPIKPGQTWQDRDERYGIRQVEVCFSNDVFVYVEGKRRVRIQVAQFRRRFKLVKDV
jgi:hypothetical protein